MTLDEIAFSRTESHFGFNTINISSLFNKQFWIWIAGQLTLFQFYTPDILRSWGGGTPNGSLWTIPVELEFYMVLPLVVLLVKRIPLNIKLLIFGIVSIAINMYFGKADTTMVKLINVSVFPYLYCFLFGVFLFNNWSKLSRYFEGKALYWTAGYIAYVFIFSEVLGLYKPEYHTNLVGFFSYFILSCLIISLAFTKIDLSEKLLRHNDISYGVYIYHMVVVNSFVALNLKHEMWMLFAVILLTLTLAFLSWRFVEKYFWGLKKKQVKAEEKFHFAYCQSQKSPNKAI